MKYPKGSFINIPNVEHLSGKPTEMQTVYFWIVQHADKDGVCFPSRARLAKESGIKSVRTIDKYVKLLVDGGFITYTKRKKKNSKEYTSNLYQVMVIEGGSALNALGEKESLDALGSANDSSLGGAPNIPITISNTNYIQRTTLPPKVEDVDNKFIFKVSYLWKELVSKYLETPEKDVYSKNIFYVIKALYKREKFKYDEFKELFNYFLDDKGVKRTDKMSFNLAMSETYVAKFKIYKRSKDKPISNSQIAESMRL